MFNWLSKICLLPDLTETRGKSKLEQLPCEHFLKQMKISRAFLPIVSHGEKCAKIQFVLEIAHKAVVLILSCL